MYLLHLHYASGFVQTVMFSSASSRAFALITLASLPVVMRCEDLDVAR